MTTAAAIAASAVPAPPKPYSSPVTRTVSTAEPAHMVPVGPVRGTTIHTNPVKPIAATARAKPDQKTPKPPVIKPGPKPMATLGRPAQRKR